MKPFAQKSLLTHFSDERRFEGSSTDWSRSRWSQLYGVTGYMIMGWTFIDALYQVVITISGVGFDEVEPMNTALLRVFTMSVIGLGMLSVAFTLGSFVQFLTETEILEYFGRHRMTKHIQTLSGHIIVAGYGRLGGLICDELAAREKPFVVIDLSPDRAAMAEARGFPVVTGDATEEHVLAAGRHRTRQGAGVRHAQRRRERVHHVDCAADVRPTS